MRHNQKGMALMGWLIVLALLGFSLTVFFKLFPVYLEDYGVKQAFEKTVSDPDISNQLPDQVREHFSKYLVTNFIKVVTPEKLMITPKDNKKNIQLDYEVRKHFIGNIDFVISFHYQEIV